MKKRPIVVLAKQSLKLDLEYGTFRIEKGRTYLDDGTTIFDVYRCEPEWFEETTRRPDTIVISHPHARKA
jgi:hypothetical protein